MLNKIKDQDATNKLIAGAILIKHPEIAKPTEIFDLSNGDFSRYEIDSINDISEVVNLKIPEDEIPNPSAILGIGNVTGQLNNPIVLHKPNLN